MERHVGGKREANKLIITDPFSSISPGCAVFPVENGNGEGSLFSNCFNSLAALLAFSQKSRLVRRGVERIINQHLSNCGFSGEGWKAALQTCTLKMF